MWYQIKRDLGGFKYEHIEDFYGYDDDFQARFTELQKLHGSNLLAEYSDDPFPPEAPIEPPQPTLQLTPKRSKTRKDKNTSDK